jgi:protein gp37
MSDLFHEKVPFAFIAQVFDVMSQAPQHVFQVLTKRPDQLLEWRDSKAWPRAIPANIWLGVSVESAAYLWRVDRLREMDVLTRFISAEPLLGSLSGLELTGISWVITGGESGGPPERALVESTKLGVRPKETAAHWVREIRELCKQEKVAFFHKQWGGRTAKSGGRMLDGREWSEYPRGSATSASLSATDR